MTEDRNKNRPGVGERPAQQVNPEKNKETRRRALKGVVAGGAVFGGSLWMKPVIESVVIPDHAQTSPRRSATTVAPTTTIVTTTTQAPPKESTTAPF